MRSVYFMFFLILAVLSFSNLAYSNDSAEILHGEIIEIFVEQNEIRVLIDDKIEILLLEAGVQVYRKGRLVALESMRPITDERYQEGLFFFNELGKVELIIVDYTIKEFSTPSGNLLIYYDIYGRIKDVEKFPFFQEGSVGF
ncbi:MAG: hypothetical protein GX994_04305 [Firmicutes bacterium]|nr:hypothetical protein [Bacillota bacterium]